MVALRSGGPGLYERSGPRPQLQICEPAYDPLSEADLSLIWAGQRFPPEALATADGMPVRVLNPGRLNSGPGPDFRDAVFELDGRRCRGDVELHVRASMWRAHGHDVDHAYDGVALHVVYLADEGGETALASGARAPVASFAPWLLGRTSELKEWLAEPALWQDPCRDAARRFGEDAVDQTLRAAGFRRFRARAERMAADAQARGEEEAVWSALLDAIGVGGDREGFRRLAAAFPARLAHEVFDVLGLDGVADSLIAVAGLGLAPPLLAGLLPRAVAPAIEVTGRPLNSPRRRLRAVAVLARGGLADRACQSVENAASVKALIEAWTVADPAGGPALLGRERAQELVLNVVLPFASSQPALVSKVEALLAAMPVSPVYGKTMFLEANLERPGGKRRVRGALAQQGLLGMVDEWCKQGGCGRCPLS